MIKADVIDNASRNKLLGFLPDTEFKEIWPFLEKVSLELNEVLWEMNEKREYVYFPTTGMICLLYDTVDGASIEIATVGKEGLAGVVTFIGDTKLANRACVHYKGEAYRMHAKDVENKFARRPIFRDICMSYTQTLIAQISQNVVCNRLHSVKQQLCRYLLTCQDHLQTNTLPVTHEYISHVLGVRRESISLAVEQIRDAGLIVCSRSKIIITDRTGLLATTCECYDNVREQYERIFGDYIRKYDQRKYLQTA
jgi:CRP-like cAMP-binding protein